MSPFSFTAKLPKNSQWILEFTQGLNSPHLFRVKKRILHQNTPFQMVDIVELFDYGKSLFLDERLQVTESDEFLYHEAITHPALITFPEPQKVLIIGGGDGGTARQVLKHRSVKQLSMIEIDGRLTKLYQKFLPEISKDVFENPRLKIFNADGRQFLNETKEKFDVIISDLTAPLLNPPSYLLFTKEFFRIIYDKLNKDGILSLQADSADCLNNKIFTAIYKTVESVFPIVRGFRVFIPSYDNNWGFIIASKKYDPASLKPSEIKKRIKTRNLKNLKFYDAQIHQPLFILPRYLKEMIKKQKKIIRDNKPIVSSE